MVDRIVAPQEEHDSEQPEATSTPLAELVEDKLNKPIAEQSAEQVEEGPPAPAPSGAPDYASGTTEHDDDQETP